MATPHIVHVADDQKPLRIDSFLAKQFEEVYSRTALKHWIKEGRVLVNGQSVKPNHQIMPGDTIRVEPTPSPPNYDQAEPIPLDIVYEDDDLLVINKPAGMVVHPGIGNKKGTLVNALLHHCQKLSSLAGSGRPGIVHRLDKNTSGLLVVAKNDWTHERLSRQFRNRTAVRIYQCVVKGVVQYDEGCYNEAIGRSVTHPLKMRVDPAAGKQAVTYFVVRKRFSRATCLDVKLSTGRTHQIRVHMAYHSHPVLGDVEYGVGSSYIGRQALHAGSFEFTHPRLEKRLSFRAPLPEDFQKLLDRLNAETSMR